MKMTVTRGDEWITVHLSRDVFGNVIATHAGQQVALWDVERKGGDLLLSAEEEQHDYIKAAWDAEYRHGGDK